MSSISFGVSAATRSAQRRLDESTHQISRSFEKLSSGFRINRASDDAAGIAIASALNSDARIYTQAVRNLNDGVSLFAIADGALSELSNITVRIKELSTQAANGSFSFTQRRALNEEANSLVDEFNRIVQSTEFNGQKVLESSMQDLTLQAGRGNNAYLQFRTNQSFRRTVGDGSYQTAASYSGAASNADLTSGDFNGDGRADLAIVNGGLGAGTTFSVYLGNGDGSLQARVAYTTGTGPGGILAADISGDGRSDLIVASSQGLNIHIGNADGTFGPRTSYTSLTGYLAGVQDVSGDGQLDIVLTGNSVVTLKGDGHGGFTQIASNYTEAGTGLIMAKLADLNNDGVQDLVGVAYDTNEVVVLNGIGNGTFAEAHRFDADNDLATSSIVAGDINRDGKLDLAIGEIDSSLNRYVSIRLGNGDGTFSTFSSLSVNTPTLLTGGDSSLLTDMTGDGINDLVVGGQSVVSVLAGNGDGTFKNAATFNGGASLFLGVEAVDLNGDGALDLATGSVNSNKVVTALANSRSVTTLSYVSLNSREDALAALTFMDTTLNRINAERGTIGSSESRTQTAIRNLGSMTDNVKAAEGRIKDVDIAQESAELVRKQILQQTGSAVLSQAKLVPEIGLRLLSGV